MKLEETLHEIVEEETNELKLQLEQKDNIILEIKQSTEQEKQLLLQTTKKEKQNVVVFTKINRLQNYKYFVFNDVTIFFQ